MQLSAAPTPASPPDPPPWSAAVAAIGQTPARLHARDLTSIAASVTAATSLGSSERETAFDCQLADPALRAVAAFQHPKKVKERLAQGAKEHLEAQLRDPLQIQARYSPRAQAQALVMMALTSPENHAQRKTFGPQSSRHGRCAHEQRSPRCSVMLLRPRLPDGGSDGQRAHWTLSHGKLPPHHRSIPTSWSKKALRFPRSGLQRHAQGEGRSSAKKLTLQTRSMSIWRSVMTGLAMSSSKEMGRSGTDLPPWKAVAEHLLTCAQTGVVAAVLDVLPSSVAPSGCSRREPPQHGARVCPQPKSPLT